MLEAENNSSDRARCLGTINDHDDRRRKHLDKPGRAVCPRFIDPVVKTAVPLDDRDIRVSRMGRERTAGSFRAPS